MSKRIFENIGFSVGVILALGFSLLPFLWFISSAFKTPPQITAIPPQWSGLSLDVFHSAIVHYEILRYLLNSVIVAGATTSVTITIAAFSGYALARLPIKWSRIILMGILACAMFPQIAIAGPIWRLLRLMGWLNTYQGLVVPYVALTLPLAVWILTTFFRELPEELESAALVDGCTRPGALIRIIIPLSTPGLFTASILCFIYAWNEFFLALLVVTDPLKQTMPVGIALFQGEHTIPWGEIAAASFITTIPLVLMVLLFQQRIVSGLSAGAIKG
jgi:multiple sugar transport system permease protein